MERWIERQVDRVDYLQTGRRERLVELLFDQLRTLDNRGRVDCRRVDVGKASQVVECVEQLFGQVGLGA